MILKNHWYLKYQMNLLHLMFLMNLMNLMNLKFHFLMCLKFPMNPKCH